MPVESLKQLKALLDAKPTFPVSVGRGLAVDAFAKIFNRQLRVCVAQIVEEAAAVLPAKDQAEFDTLLLAILPKALLVLSALNQQSASEKAVRAALCANFRLFILVIETRLDKLSSASPVLAEHLTTFSKTVGRVPVLNPVLPLPDAKHMPPRYYKSTAANHAKIAWDEPGRNKEQKVEFYSVSVTSESGKTQFSSVRQHLLEEDVGSLTTKEKKQIAAKQAKAQFALSYADIDFYRPGDLHADHLQPSAQILSRQLEMLTVMNIDPLFAAKMQEVGKDKGYFAISGAESKQIQGTKRFFMEYHNCIDNLWLVSVAENSGQGKGQQDPIDWLMTHPHRYKTTSEGASIQLFGKAFFDAIGGLESINQDCILYTTAEDVLLARAAKTWFREHYKEEIYGANFSLGIKDTVKAAVASVSDSSSKRSKLRVMASAVIAKIATQAPLSSKKDPSIVESSPGKAQAKKATSVELGLASEKQPLSSRELDDSSSSDDYKGVPHGETEFSEANLQRVEKMALESDSLKTLELLRKKLTRSVVSSGEVVSNEDSSDTSSPQ